MTSFRERLIEAMQLRKMTQSDLSKATGLSKARISQYVNGTYEAKQQAVYLLAKALCVNITWLMGLDVPMTDISVDHELPKNTADISEDEKLLIDLFRSVPDDKKKRAIEMIRAALKAQ